MGCVHSTNPLQGVSAEFPLRCSATLGAKANAENSQAFATWAISHFMAFLLFVKQTARPQPDSNFTSDQIKELTPQMVYWLNASQRAHLNTSYLTSEQKIAFFQGDAACWKLVQNVEGMAVKARVSFYLGEMRELTRLEEGQQSAHLLKIMKAILSDTLLNDKAKESLFEQCLRNHGDNVAQVIGAGSENVNRLFCKVYRTLPQPQPGISLALTGWMESLPSQQWRKMSSDFIANILECRFTHLNEDDNRHAEIIFEHLASSPLLKDVLKELERRHQGDLTRYQKFYSAVFAKGSEEDVQALITSWNKIALKNIDAVLECVHAAIGNKKEHIAIRNAIVQICRKAEQPNYFKAALLQQMYVRLQTGAHHIFDHVQTEENLWVNQTDLSVPFLGDRQRLNSALEKWQSGQNLDSMSSCAVNFLMGAVVLSTCSVREYQFFLKQVEQKHPKSVMPYLLLLPCCRFLQFSDANASFSAPLEEGLLNTKMSAVDLIKQLQSFPFPESEGLAGVVFDLIRRKQGSAGLMDAFASAFFSTPHAISAHAFHSLTYLRDSEVRILATKIYESHKHKQAFEGEVVCRVIGAFRKMSQQEFHPVWDGKRLKWQAFFDNLISQCDESQQKQIWKQMLNSLSAADIVDTLQLCKGATEAVIKPLVEVLQESKPDVLRQFLSACQASAEFDSLIPFVVTMLSSQLMMQKIAESSSCAELANLCHMMEGAAAAKEWPFENRVSLLHGLITHLKEARKFFELSVISESLQKILFATDVERKEFFKFCDLEAAQQIQECPDEIKAIHNLYVQRQKTGVMKQASEVLAIVGMSSTQTVDFQKVDDRLAALQKGMDEKFQDGLNRLSFKAEQFALEIDQLEKEISSASTDQVSPIRERMLQLSQNLEQTLTKLREAGRQLPSNPFVSLSKDYSKLFSRLKGDRGLFSVLQSKANKLLAEESSEEQEALMDEVVIYNSVDSLRPREDKIQVNMYLDNFKISWADVSALIESLNLPVVRNSQTDKYQNDFGSFGIASFEDLKRAVDAISKCHSHLSPEDMKRKGLKSLKDLELFALKITKS